jgi:hypothetical protein
MIRIFTDSWENIITVKAQDIIEIVSEVQTYVKNAKNGNQKYMMI